MARHSNTLSGRSVLYAALALCLTSTETARAQEQLVGDGVARFFLGAGPLLAIPQGEFALYVGPSPGIGAFLLFNFDEQRYFGLRLDGAYVYYGGETVRRPLSTTIRRVLVDVSTSNQIFSLSVGPQLTIPFGALRPYLNAGAGFSYFVTTSSARGSDNWDSFARSTNFDDFTFAWSGGGGLWIDISNDIQLSFSTQYTHNGRVRYLKEGGIREAADGTLRFAPIESTANLLLFQIGVSFSLRSATDTRPDD
jgi:opacity protein-like surface antigen